MAMAPADGPRWVQTGSEVPPLVAVHSWVNEVANYERLSQAMGGQRIYSLLPPDPRSANLPRRMSAWVDHHDAALQALGLEPPYRLVGWSFGGIVAAELARRRYRLGEDIAYVGMIDTLRPRLTPLTTSDYVWYHLTQAAALSEGQRAGYLYRKGRHLLTRRFPRSARLATRVQHAVGRRPAPAPSETRRAHDPLQIAVWAAYLNYQEPALELPAHFYVVGESVERSRGPVLGWLPYLHGGYSLRRIEGDHFTVFDPANVDSVAAAITTDLAALPPAA